MGNLWAFILLIGPLIFVHELGHLLAAKLVDVKVTRFSIGFGPALVRFRLGETEYCLAPIPLGGYVSLLGQTPGEKVPSAEADRSLQSKPLWARFLVLGAGPIANLLLPILVYFFYFVIQHTTVTPAVIGTVLDDSAAAAAGLRQGDRIVAIDQEDVRSWTEMRHRVEDAAGEELRVQVEREGKRLDRVVTPHTAVIRDPLGTPQTIGRLGVLPVFYAPQIGIIDPTAAAASAGLRTGDIITSINGEPVRTREELEHMLKMTPDTVVRLTYLHPHEIAVPGGLLLSYTSHHAQLRPRPDSTDLGILLGATFIRRVEPGSPAARAGLSVGDTVLAVDDRAVRSWAALQDLLTLRAIDEPVTLTVQSPGAEPRQVQLQLESKIWEDVYNQEHEQWWFGAHAYDQSWVSDPEPLRGRFTYALSSSVRETVLVIDMMWTALVQMLTFERGVEELSSVVGLYKVAGTAFEQGPGPFLLLVALLSINLGFINLLPIPVLDGGHLMFFTIEAIRRRPLSQRSREIASAIGLVIILLLLLVATRNDIIRHWL